MGRKDIKASEAFLALLDPRVLKATAEWACQVRRAKQVTGVREASKDQAEVQVERVPLGDTANQDRAESMA